MFICKTNVWNGKSYTYDSDEYDMFTPMFDEQLHNNDHIAQIVNPYVCGYCQTSFESRSRLFYHLGFMGIDVRSKYGDQDHVRRHRKRRNRRWYSYKRSRMTPQVTTPPTYNNTDDETVSSKRLKITELENAIKVMKI
jgi:hypothetical protein